MAASREWREWHLTPRGWVRGTVKYDFDKTELPTPPERVLTCTYTEEVTSPVSPAMSRTVDEDWRSEDLQLVETLLKQYGECPRSL